MVEKVPDFRATSAAWKRPRYWTRKTRCPEGESRRPLEYTKGDLDWTGNRPGHPSCHPPTGITWSFWIMWHMIQKDHVTPTATSYHPLTKAERFCQKFFSTIILTMCTECLIRKFIPHFVVLHLICTILHLFLVSYMYCTLSSSSFTVHIE